ncbi:MAG: hypothetical protein ACFFCW_26250 [Candidatus Hodarchaeota archaeon]
MGQKNSHTAKESGDTSKGRGRKLIICLFIVGMVFIVISTFLSLSHYYYSERLAEKNETFRIYGLDSLLYQINEQSSINTSFMILLGTEMVPPYKNLDYFKQHFQVQNIEILSSLHRVLFGEDADPALVAEWRKINEPNKFQDEKKKMFDRGILFKDNKADGGPTKFGLNLLNQIESLTSRQHGLMTALIIFQVIGLALNQIAIILQIVWKKA